MATIPEGSLLTALRGYVAASVGCPPGRITAVSRFQDGNRHAVYKVSYLGPTDATEDLVVRVSYGGGPDDRAQAEQEARVLKKAGGIAAPLLYDFRSSSPWFDTPSMCMQFVAGRQTELSSATATEIGRLGSVVAWVHGLPADDLVDRQSEPADLTSYAEERLRSIIATAVWVRDPLPAPVQVGLRTAADSVRRSWDRARDAPSFGTGGALALLHGDIGPGNILWSPDPVLIDWEYARLGDPADEIAYLFDQNGLTPYQREAFWHGYQESVSSQPPLAHVIERVDWWEPVTLLGSTLWWAERWVRRANADADDEVDHDVPRDPGYYSDHVIRRLNRLDRLLVQN
jgi:aminoglycoside phosphotransferase (APT) family kinase protein